ncbi:MAG: epoxide hydrolase family protein [Caulobacterales bacterium]
MTPEPFKIEIPDARLVEMQKRLKATSWPGDFGNEDWRYGVEQEWLRSLAAYWADEYDWRKHETAMNALPQFKVNIDGVPIHFIHIKSGRPNSIPLLLTHGWPWTFWDWEGVIKNLSASKDGPAFDIVVPSLPGVTFSSPLQTTGLNVRAIAKLWVRLMCEALGYDRFAAAGGDWGSLITAELGHAHPERLLGIHLTLVALPGVNHLSLAPQDFAEDEQWMLARNLEALPMITSHVTVQSSDPQTLAYALADSPVGTAAWIWERRRAWSDCGGDIIAYQGRDFLCTIASLYWLTNTIGSSMRIYKEHFSGAAGLGMNWPLLNERSPMIPVPTGVAVAPKELALLPKALVARHSNLKRWQIMPKGGHFLPSEAPDLLAEEYRRFFGQEFG